MLSCVDMNKLYSRLEMCRTNSLEYNFATTLEHLTEISIISVNTESLAHDFAFSINFNLTNTGVENIVSE